MITGLTITGSQSENTGLFRYLEGTVSRLTLNGASINITASGEYSPVSFFGFPVNIWDDDPRQVAPHVIDCHVTSSTVRINAGGNTATGCSVLVAAQNSSASSINIEINGANMAQKLLWNCIDSNASGTLSLTLNSNGQGDASVIEDSMNCSANFDVFIDLNNYSAGKLAVHGVYSRRENGVCENDILNGTIYSPGYTAVIDRATFCTSHANVWSDDLRGIHESQNCIIDGTLSNTGESNNIQICFIDDEMNSSDKKGNVCDATLNYLIKDTIPEMFTVRSNLGPNSALNTDVVLDNMTSTKTEVYYEPTIADLVVYRHGIIDITTTTGAIDINCKLASDAETHAASDSGAITVVAGKWNSGAVEVQSESGIVGAIGGILYNSGRVQAVSGGNAAATGVIGDNGVNEGDIYAESNGQGAVATAIGASGANGWNQGNVSAVNSGTGDASASGAMYGLNSVNVDEVSATTENGEATAYGTHDGYNSGNVTAEGNGMNIHAEGGNSNTGVITATNRSSVRESTANAYAGAGTAIASGVFARAEGASATASSTYSGQTASGEMCCWMLVYHSSEPHTCNNPPQYIVNSSEEPFDTEYHKWGIFAVAHNPSGTAGEQPAHPEGSMPEEEEADESQISVSVRLIATSGNEITAFTRTFGSFTWDGDNTSNDYMLMTLEIVLQNDGTKAAGYNSTIHLPDGFSFSQPSFESTRELSCYLHSGETKPFSYEVFPIYSEQSGPVTVSLAGDINRVKSYPCGVNANEGLILMRPTGGVNENYPEPFKERISLNPVSDFITGSKTSYSQRLAILGCTVSQAVYNTAGQETSDSSLIRQSLRNLGFNRIIFSNNIDSHDVAVGFAQKKIIYNGEIHTVLMVIVRGTVDTEWTGNFNVLGEDEGVHADFNRSANSVMERMKQYCETFNVPSDAHTYMCAHSRGGAVADLIAHAINQGSFRGYLGDCVTYTFAAPNCTKTPMKDANIFNYCYKYDVVPYLPHRLFGKYGQNILVGGTDQNDAPQDVMLRYMAYTGLSEYKCVGWDIAIQAIISSDNAQEANNFFTEHQDFFGSMANNPTNDFTRFIAKAHSGENYLAWVKENGTAGNVDWDLFEAFQADTFSSRILDKAWTKIQKEIEKHNEEVLRERYKDYLVENHPLSKSSFESVGKYAPVLCQEGAEIYGIGCPVDVELLSGDDIVGELIAHQKVSMANGVFAFGDGESSYLIIPRGTDYTLRITGTGDGEMIIDYAYFADYEECTDAYTYINVPVHEGDVFTISADGDGGVPVLNYEGSSYLPLGMDYEINENVLVRYNGINQSPPIPEGVTEVGEQAFQGNTSITSIELPDNVTLIGAGAFAACTGLTHVSLPTSITSIPASAFAGCSALTDVAYSAVTDIGESAFANCTALTVFPVYSGVQRVGNNAFTGCTALTQVDFPASVNAMGSGMFTDCTALRNVTMPVSIERVPNNSFINCTNLYFIQLPANLTSIGSKAFQYCSTLRSIFIPAGVTSIDRAAFMGCTGMIQVYCAGSEIELSDMTFWDCTALQKVTLPPTVTGIIDTTFRNVPTTCRFYTFGTAIAEQLRGLGYVVSAPTDPPSSAIVSGMQALKIPAGTTVIEVEAFDSCAFQRVILPSGLKTIQPRAFQYCTNLIYINIPDTVETIAWDAFRGCTGVFFECSTGSVGESFAVSHGYTTVIK